MKFAALLLLFLAWSLPLHARMPPLALVLSGGNEGADDVDQKSDLDASVPVLKLGATKYFEFATEYWANEHLGLRAAFQRLNQRKTISEFLSPAGGGVSYLFNRAPGHVEQKRFWVGPMLRFGFSKGTFAVLVSYEVSVWTDGVLTHDNQSYASVFVDEFKEKSSRTSFGLEWMFMRDGGLRLFYSSVKSQWSELNTLATSKDLELEMGQLSLSYVFRF